MIVEHVERLNAEVQVVLPGDCRPTERTAGTTPWAGKSARTKAPARTSAAATRTTPAAEVRASAGHLGTNRKLTADAQIHGNCRRPVAGVVLNQRFARRERRLGIQAPVGGLFISRGVCRAVGCLCQSWTMDEERVAIGIVGQRDVEWLSGFRQQEGIETDSPRAQIVANQKDCVARYKKGSTVVLMQVQRIGDWRNAVSRHAVGR